MRQKQLVVSKQCRFWLMPDRAFFILPMVTGAGLFQTPMGWVGIYTLDAQKVPVLAVMHVLENEEISSGRSEGFGFMI